MAKLPQQLQAIQSALPMTYQNVPAACELFGRNHLTGDCPQQNVKGEEVQYMRVHGRQVGQ